MPRNNSKPNRPTTYTPDLRTLRERLTNQEWTFLFLELDNRVLISWIATTPARPHRFTANNCSIARCPYCHSPPRRQILTFGTRTYDSLSVRDVASFIQNYGTVGLRNLIVGLGRLNEEVGAGRLDVLRSGRDGRARGRH